jgi:hypothetical protein
MTAVRSVSLLLLAVVGGAGLAGCQTTESDEYWVESGPRPVYVEPYGPPPVIVERGPVWVPGPPPGPGYRPGWRPPPGPGYRPDRRPPPDPGHRPGWRPPPGPSTGIDRPPPRPMPSGPARPYPSSGRHGVQDTWPPK